MCAYLFLEGKLSRGAASVCPEESTLRKRERIKFFCYFFKMAAICTNA